MSLHRITFNCSDELFKKLEAVCEGQRIKPTRARVIRMALEPWLDKELRRMERD